VLVQAWNARMSAVRPMGSSCGRTFFVTEWTFDELDRVSSITDSLGNVWQQFYDSRDNVVRRIDPLGNTETLRYDIYGRCVQYGVRLTDSGLGSGNPPRLATSRRPISTSEFFAVVACTALPLDLRA
jgi:YD repeat-containing protein